MHCHREPLPKYNPRSTDIQRNNYKWDLLKSKSFCTANDMVNKAKWQPTEWEKIFTNPTSDRGLIFKIHKELKRLHIRKTKNPIKNREQT